MSTDERHVDHAITKFEQTLFLPLYLPHPASPAADHASPSQEAGRVGELLVRGKNPWQEIRDLLAHLGPIDSKAYEELVYFHSHLHPLMFPRDGEPDRRGSWGMRLFERQDLKRLRAVFVTDGVPWRITLEVRRLQLYLSAAGVAMLVVELGAEPNNAIGILEKDSPKRFEEREAKDLKDLDLHYVLALQNAVRRLYPPFFDEKKGGDLDVNYYPRWWAWIDKDGMEVGASVSTPEAHVLSFRQGTSHVRPRAVPLANVWRFALSPLIVDGDSESRAGDLRWTQPGDERMPSMTLIAAPGAPNFSEGEWARICFMDDPESPGDDGKMAHNYADGFMQGFLGIHAYDRFWSGDVGNTRYLIAGYSFVVVTVPNKDPDAQGNDWFARNIIPHHFRRHYFRMGLMLHFQHTALLAMASWAGTIGQRFGGFSHRRQLREQLADLRQTFLVFATQLWTPELTNQLQGRELHVRWRAQIGSESQFEALSARLGAMSEHLQALEQGANTEASTHLAGAATVAAALGIPIAFLSIADGIFSKFQGTSDTPALYHWKTDVLTSLTALSASAMVILLVIWWWRRMAPVALIRKFIALLVLPGIGGWVGRWQGWW